MRMIDADALYKVIEDHVTTVSVCPSVDWAMGKSQFKKMCLEDIKYAPTVDAEPVRHEHWVRDTVDTPDIWFCTACRYCIAWCPSYCPNCGAKMEGTKNE